MRGAPFLSGKVTKAGRGRSVATKRQGRGGERETDDATIWPREIEHEPHFLHRLPRAAELPSSSASVFMRKRIYE